MRFLGRDNGMVWEHSGSFEGYMAKIRGNSSTTANSTDPRHVGKRAGGFWLEDPALGPAGSVSTRMNQPARKLPRATDTD